MAVIVPYHQQTMVDWCGAACLRMVIQALNGQSGTQSQLFAEANTHGGLDPGSPWKSPPDGIEWVLKQRTGLQASAVTVLAVPHEEVLTRHVIWGLHQHGVPPIVLVYGWAHWVVVVAFDVSKNPTGPNDQSYDIEAVHIHNPWRQPEEGVDPPPPPPKHVAFSYWQKKYLRQVPQGYWDRMMVAVGVFT